MPRAQGKKAAPKAAAKPAKQVEVKELPTSPEELTDKQAEGIAGGKVRRNTGPAGLIWWNPLPIQPADGLKNGKARKRVVGAYRKGGRGPQGG